MTEMREAESAYRKASRRIESESFQMTSEYTQESRVRVRFRKRIHELV